MSVSIARMQRVRADENNRGARHFPNAADADEPLLLQVIRLVHKNRARITPQLLDDPVLQL